MSSVKRPRGVEDLLAEMKKTLGEAVTARKIPDDIKLNYIRKITESISLSESVAGDPNKASVSESISLTESVSATQAERYELEQVDGSHSNEVVIKIGFWELLA